MKGTNGGDSFSGAVDTIFAITSSKLARWDETGRIIRENVKDYSLVFVQQGKGDIWYNGDYYQVSAGDICLLSQHSSYICQSNAQDPWVIVEFHLYGTLVQNLLKGYGLQNQVRFTGCGPFVGDLFDRMLNLADSEDSASQEQAAVIFHQIAAQLYKRAQPADKPGKQIAQEMRRYIDAHVEDGFTVDELCDKLHLSRSGVFRHFQQSYGLTPCEYYQQRRLEAAQNLLRSSTMSVQEIAGKLQFADQRYFSGWFKKQTGMAPREYRKQPA